MIFVRPYEIFALVARPPNDRAVNVQIPHRRGFGSLTLLESLIVIAMVEATRASRIFEFGTFNGGTTLNLAANLPTDGEIFTLDLGRSNEIFDQDPADTKVRARQSSQGVPDYVGSSVHSRIHQLFGDSTTFDFSPWRGRMNLVFVDGGHDLKTVTSDTRNAFKLVDESEPGAILWHDYKNPSYPALTKFLEDLSTERTIFHVGDAMLCMWFNDKAKHLSEKLACRIDF